MKECWLRCNRRAVLVGCIPPLMIAVLGVILWTWRWPQWSTGLVVLRVAGSLLLLLGLTTTGLLLGSLRRPRVGYVGGFLELDLRTGSPIRVPVELVECFFLGQGPVQVGVRKNQPSTTAQLIVRLAERADTWQQGHVKAALGDWRDGYITVHGVWCEPLNTDVVRRINSRLAQVKRQTRPESSG